MTNLSVSPPSANSSSNTPNQGGQNSKRGAGSGGFLNTAFLLASGYSIGLVVSKGCRQEDKTISAGSLRLPKSDQYSSVAEALQAVKSGKVVPMEEIATSESAFSVFLFRATDKSQTLTMLRGLGLGSERSDFLKEMKSLGHDVPLVITGTTTATVGKQPNEPQAQRPFYEPFIMPTVLLVGIYAVYKGFSRFGTKIGEALGKIASDPMGKAKFSTEIPSHQLKDYGGNRRVVAVMHRLVEDIKRVMQGEARIRLQKGFLLCGDPGTGKSFLMKCLAGEAKCPIVNVSGAELRTSPFMGSRAKGVEDFFAALREARDQRTKELRAGPGATGKEQAVAIGLIDEVDSVGRTRNANGNSSENDDGINALLANLDGTNSHRNHNIILFGATNDADIIDPALRRPGRFNREIDILLPETSADRFDVMMKMMPSLFEELECLPPAESDLRFIAEATIRVTPAEIKGMFEESARSVEPGKQVSVGDMLSAYQTVKLGMLRESSERMERRLLVSVHEFGHALTAIAFGVRPVIIAMRPRGDSLGRVFLGESALLEPPNTRSDLIKLMIISAGGRAGELVSLGGTGEASNGVEGDFGSLSKIAKNFLSSGMLDGSFSLAVHGIDDTQLPVDYQDAVEAVGDAAVLAATKILKTIPPEVFDAIAADAIDQEHYGAAAVDYLHAHLSPPVRDALAKVAAEVIAEYEVSVRQQLEFLRDPGSAGTYQLLKQTLEKMMD